MLVSVWRRSQDPTPLGVKTPTAFSAYAQARALFPEITMAKANSGLHCRLVKDLNVYI